jgi:hypothetical protein
VIYREVSGRSIWSEAGIGPHGWVGTPACPALWIGGRWVRSEPVRDVEAPDGLEPTTHVAAATNPEQE